VKKNEDWLSTFSSVHYPDFDNQGWALSSVKRMKPPSFCFGVIHYFVSVEKGPTIVLFWDVFYSRFSIFRLSSCSPSIGLTNLSQALCHAL